jgi:uncharacterized protein (TIGR03067 family)
MRKYLAIGVALALAALVRADGGGDSGAYTLVGADDRAELERGEWRVVEMTSGGRERPKAQLEQNDMRMVFKNGRLHTKIVGAPTRGGDMRVTLYPDSTPKQIEWELTPKHKNLGIYKLEGDKLTIAVGLQRPTEFSPEKATSFYVLKRVNP